MESESKSTSPGNFALEDYFQGRTRAWGIVQDRFGRLRRQFTVELEGRRDGDTLVLDEMFNYDDGSQSARRWVVRRLGEGRYEGKADDIVGTAVGWAEGTRVVWRYRLRLRIGKRDWVVAFYDEMLLQSDGVMINRAIMRKVGVRLGDLTIAFRREVDFGAGRPLIPTFAESRYIVLIFSIGFTLKFLAKPESRISAIRYQGPPRIDPAWNESGPSELRN